MAGLEASELQRLATGGQLYAKYAQSIDRESAHEMITARIAAGATTGGGRYGAEAADIEPIDAKETAKQARAEERARRQAERDRIAEERARHPDAPNRGDSGTRLVTSRAGSDLIRGSTRHVLRRETLVGRRSAHGPNLTRSSAATERFARKSLTPRARRSSISRVWRAAAVTTTTRTSPRTGRRRSSSSSCKPLMPGMDRSVNTIDGRSRSMAAKPAAPSLTICTGVTGQRAHRHLDQPLNHGLSSSQKNRTMVTPDAVPRPGRHG